MREFLRWFDARGDLRAVCVFRIFAGPLAFVHLWPFASDLLDGTYYRDAFYVPWFAHYPEPSKPVYGVLIALGMLAAAAMSVGFWSRLATRTCFAVVTYNFFLSETFFHHNRAFLLIFLGGLSLVPSGDSVSIDALLRRTPPPPRPLWPLWLWRAEACVPYIASSTSKLIDPEWFAGIITWDRVERYRAAYHGILPGPLLDFAASPQLHFWLAKLVIALELCVGIGLWIARTRYLAVWLGLVFHVMVQLSAEIQVFSLLGVCGLLIWTTPRIRQRRLLLRLDLPEGRRWQSWVRRLDWLARFEVRAADGGGDVLTLIERDGSRWTGRAAKLRVLSRFPITAGVALPLIGFELFHARPAPKLSGAPAA